MTTPTPHSPEKHDSSLNSDIIEVDVRNLFLACWKYKKYVIGVAALISIVGYIYIQRMPYKYEASATILPLSGGGKQGKSLNPMALLSNLTGQSSQPKSLEVILSSRSFREALIKKYNLMPDLFQQNEGSALRPEYEGQSKIKSNLEFETSLEGGMVISYVSENRSLPYKIVNGILETLQDFIQKNGYTKSQRNRELIEARLKLSTEELQNMTRQKNTQNYQMTYEIKQNIHRSLHQALEQAKLEEIRNSLHFEIIDAPQEPIGASYPNKKKFTYLLIIGSFMLSVFGAFMYESIKTIFAPQ